MKIRIRREVWLVLIGLTVAVAPSFRPEPPAGRHVDMSSSVLKFPFDDLTGTVSDVPASLRELDGKRVTVTGIVFLGDSTGNHFTKGQIVRDRDLTGFGGPPLVQRRVFATAVPGSPAAATTMPIELLSSDVNVTGTFHVRVALDPTWGRIGSVFTLDADQIAVAGNVVPPSREPWVPLIRTFGVVLAALAVASLVHTQLVEQRRRSSGHCVQCGYDLRHSPGVCPECGSQPG